MHAAAAVLGRRRRRHLKVGVVVPVVGAALVAILR